MADTTTTVEYYKDLLPYQWVNSTNARATVGVLTEAALCDLLPLDVQNAFNIETAVGPQLDTLGKYIGFSRRVIGQVQRDYFTLADYNSATPVTGLTDWTDPLQNSGSSTFNWIYGEGSYSDLGDDEYRYLLRWKIALNNTDSSLYKIDQFIFSFFPDGASVWDNKDMTMIYYLPRGLFSEQVVEQGLLPRPMGVGLTYYVSDSPSQISGLADYNALSDPTWGGMPDYNTGSNGWQWLNYEDEL